MLLTPFFLLSILIIYLQLPFDKIISCNIGNPQALEQKNLSFIRDVLSLVINPNLKLRAAFPADVIERAEKYLGITSKLAISIYN